MTPAVTVRGLLDARPESVGLSIELLAGAGGLHRKITSPYIQKTGLALAGFHEYLQAGRILLFGESEVRFLESLDTTSRHQALAKCFTGDLPCLQLTGGADVAPEILLEGERAGVPILRTAVPTAAARLLVVPRSEPTSPASSCGEDVTNTLNNKVTSDPWPMPNSTRPNITGTELQSLRTTKASHNSAVAHRPKPIIPIFRGVSLS